MALNHLLSLARVGSRRVPGSEPVLPFPGLSGWQLGSPSALRSRATADMYRNILGWCPAWAVRFSRLVAALGRDLSRGPHTVVTTRRISGWENVPGSDPVLRLGRLTGSRTVQTPIHRGSLRDTLGVTVAFGLNHRRPGSVSRQEGGAGLVPGRE